MKLPKSGTFGTVTTSATGASWATLPDIPCHDLSLANLTGADLEFRRGGSGQAVIVPDGGGWQFEALENASDLQVRRVDQSNTQVTVKLDTILR